MSPSKKIKLSMGKGRALLGLDAQKVGEDWCVHITGGRGHIGACAVGSVDSKSGRAFASLITLPGHKEGTWALRLAEDLARKLGGTVLVTMGIHLDGIRSSEIRRLEKNVQKVVSAF